MTSDQGNRGSTGKVRKLIQRLVKPWKSPNSICISWEQGIIAWWHALSVPLTYCSSCVMVNAKPAT